MFRVQVGSGGARDRGLIEDYLLYIYIYIYFMRAPVHLCRNARSKSTPQLHSHTYTLASLAQLED